MFNLIRGLNSIPGAYTTLNGKTVKVFDVRLGEKKVISESGTILNLDDKIEVQCKDGTIYIDSLQFEGKKRTSSIDFLRGNKKLLENGRFE